MTGSDLIIKILVENGVTKCFGYPGGAAMPIYDSLYRYKGKIRHIRTAHEQGAAHSADGYARSTGKLGVCFATSGPGATNLITGIATAYADSVPMLFITANVSTDEIGTDSFQEADITGMTLSVTKYNWIVKKPENLAETLYKAIRLATSGRPGPVLVDVPKDILVHRFSDSYNFRKFANLTGSEAELRIATEETVSDDELIKASEIINSAKAPFIILGGGINISGSEAKELAARLSQKIKAPISETLMAIGTLPSDDPLYAGMIGKYGSPKAKKLIERSDVIIAVGMRFSNRTHQFDVKGKHVIHIDADRAEVNKNIHAECALIGDAKDVIKKLLPLAKEKKKAWCSDILEQDEISDIKEYFDIVAKETAEGRIVVTDVGTHQMTVANYFPFDGKTKLITSGGFGTMGFGISAAAGAKIGNPEKETVLFTGDGSFKMGISELLTLKENKLKILVVVMNNGALGMVRDMQKNDFQGRYIATESRVGTPNISAVAKAYGLKGIKVLTPDDLKKALEIYKKSRTSVVIDLRI